MDGDFFMTQSKKLRRWELALLLGVALAALLGVWLDRSQTALADQVIRLHVLANSDSEADQALKLKVRDRVLETAEEYFTPGATLEETQAVLTAHLADIAAAGAEQVAEEGYQYPVTVSMEENYWFPTKEYTDFALPAGNYTALRVVIGEGGGQNWWCVVFPPLCLGSVSETAAQTALSGGFSEDQVSLITGEDEGYVVKFKAIELWEEFQHWLAGA
ncbi:stage II sporulation protein R [uncultured Flavonifractor sp.]|uniref:stage II sporulation protein R n=1 Tax=uncultured Flavonifractor sp. TaxID=1193534 RepID=UPI00261B89D8|nr:stage II sporulation protein R [uncultured Flavonifractor sp.]